ncbi:MAG: hypothetical protein LBQ73_11045 [Tannerellaceae bacterium]|jgi:hypothetical protein|nr:hypothetical protein [Tannerellaceae bacterium]
MTKVDDIKALAAERMVEIVGRYVPLKQKGKEYIGKCPFHDDHTPSLMVNPAKQTWWCFACSAGGHGGFSFVERMEKGDFLSTLRRVADMLNVDLDEGRRISLAARQEQVEAVGEPQFEYKPWTDAELILMGSPRNEDGTAQWTGEEMETLFSLYSVAHYTLPPSATSTTGKSVRRYSSDIFPIFTYRYEDAEGRHWGRLYLPFNKRGSKFYYWPSGRSHTADVYADKHLADALENARRGRAHDKFAHVLICSGGSDAINAYKHCHQVKKSHSLDGEDVEKAAIHVCWLGSESSHLSVENYKLLNKVATTLYICYDQDETGVNRMHAVALQYINIHVVYLPVGMNTSTEGRCKDIRDFFKSYTHAGNKGYDFALWLYTSQSVKFWTPKRDKQGEPNGKFDLVTSAIKLFANVNGIYTYAAPGGELAFVEVARNMVRLIKPADIDPMIRGKMEQFVKSNAHHYNLELLETINKTKLITDRTMRLLNPIALNFRYPAADQDYFVFRNGIFRITRNRIEKVTPAEANFYVFEEKVIPHDFTPIDEPPFRVHYSAACENLMRIRREAAHGSVEWDQLSRQIGNMPGTEKYCLEANFDENTLSYIRYIYNTGRTFWQKEKRGERLTEQEQREHDLNFINKCWSLGHLLRKHKEESKGIGILAIESEVLDSEDADGRSGKSLFFKYMKLVRNVHHIGMRQVDVDRKSDTLLSGVRQDMTDMVILDDLRREHRAEYFFNYITEDMDVRRLHCDPVSIPYKESPKLAITSNYCPKLDGSTRGRINFVLFSDYYHAKTPEKGYNEYNPRMEFGHELVDDYSPDEMNRFYNFMAACIQLNMQFPEKIEPVMEHVELRSLKDELGNEAIYDWMERTFSPAATHCLLDIAVWRDELFEEYKKCLGREYRERVTLKNFRTKVIKYCSHKGWILNPNILFRTQSERERGDYRKSHAGQDDHFWYIQTQELTPETKRAFADRTVAPIPPVPPPPPMESITKKMISVN